MKKVNIYDFDDTIYKGDSGVDFFKYSFKKKPFLIILTILKIIFPTLGYVIKVVKFKRLKEMVFSYVKHINNLDLFVEDFIKENKSNVKDWYIKQQREDDLIISASLDFYLIPLCKALNINNVICTKYDTKRGKIIGNNCHDEEKVKIINKKYPNIEIEKAYSDSNHDIPMLNLAKESYIVKNETIVRRK